MPSRLRRFVMPYQPSSHTVTSLSGYRDTRHREQFFQTYVKRRRFVFASKLEGICLSQLGSRDAFGNAVRRQCRPIKRMPAIPLPNGALLSVDAVTLVLRLSALRLGKRNDQLLSYEAVSLRHRFAENIYRRPVIFQPAACGSAEHAVTLPAIVPENNFFAFHAGLSNSFFEILHQTIPTAMTYCALTRPKAPSGLTFVEARWYDAGQ